MRKKHSLVLILLSTPWYFSLSKCFNPSVHPISACKSAALPHQFKSHRGSSLAFVLSAVRVQNKPSRLESFPLSA